MSNKFRNKFVNSFGFRLKEEREKLDLDQTEMAESCGVKRPAQSNYENNKRSPDANYLMAAKDLGVDINYLFTGEMYGNFDGDDFTRVIEGDTPERDFAFYMQQIRELYGKPLKDKEIATVVLGANENTFATWKRTNKVPFEELVKFCTDFGYSLNWFFAGIGEPKLPEQAGEPVSGLPKDTTIKVDKLRDSLALVLEIIEKLREIGEDISHERAAQLVAMIYELLAEGKKVTDNDLKWLMRMAS
jgi:transcriptional regulator with XRE-family HTH domain